MRRPTVVLTQRSAKLSEEFGRDWATKLFGAAAVASLPLLQRGPNKGKPKHHVIWRKAVTGGWCSDVQSPVKAGQIVDAWIAEGPMSPRDYAVSGDWLGRTQPLAGSSHYLFETGRQRHADGVAREEARRKAQWADEDADRAATKAHEG